MNRIVALRTIPLATFCLLLAAGRLDAVLTLDQALELSRNTGRPILAVAGSKT